MNHKSNFASGEFKARLPWVSDISTDVLKVRAEEGVKTTLIIATALAGKVSPETSRELIASCNFSTSQVVKTLKARGVKA